MERNATVNARREAEASETAISPGQFARDAYLLELPTGWTGPLTIETAVVAGGLLQVDYSGEVPSTGSREVDSSRRRGVIYFLKGHKHAENAGDYDPNTFFKQHISGHEPLYFIAGPDSPNAKFQISFKYQLLNEHGRLATMAPLLRGFHLAYSQTSLWDLNSPSAPFFDSSYRPELLYSWEEVFGGPTNWFTIDLQGGVQHESNGRDAENSRSLNIAYFRPRFTLGNETGPQLTLMPRVWVYIGDLSDNPDLDDYRGFADLRTIFGWKRGLQVSALGRMGQRLSQGSVTVDVTYPLMQPPAGSFSLYLHAQYFTGYGESLVGYDERTDVFRAGISLFR